MAATVTPSRTGSRQLVLLCAAAVLAAPVVVDPGALDPHLPLRFLLLSSVLVIVLGTASIAAGPARILQQVPPTVLLAWVGLVVVAFAAASGAPVPLESLLGDGGRRFGALSVLLLFLAFLLGTVVADRLGALLRLGPVLILMVVAAMLWRSAMGSPVAARAVLVGNAGQLGGYLLLLLGAASVVARHDPDRRWRRFAVTSLPLGVGALLLTGSHAAAAGAAALALAWLASGELAGASRLARSGLVVGVLAMLVVAVLWIERFRVLSDSWEGRLATWSVAWEAFLARPWLGWGPDGFRHGFAAHVPADFVRRYGDDRITDRAHSIVLEPLVAMGIIGSLVVALLVALYLRHRTRHDATARGTARALFALAIFLLAWFPEVEIAAIVALLAGATSRSGGDAAAGPTPLTVGVGRWSPALLVVLLAVGMLANLGVATAGLVTDRRVAGELQALSSGAEPTANPVLPAATHWSGVTALLVAVPAVRSAGELPALLAARDAVVHPRDAERTTLRADLSGTIARRTGDPAELRRAVAAYERALVLAPNHSLAWLGLGELLLLSGDAGAQPALERAAELRPGDVAPRANLAILAMSRGDATAAVRHLRRACELAPADPQLGRFAMELGRQPQDLGCVPPG